MILLCPVQDPWASSYLVTLTLKFDLLLKNFNLGCYSSYGCRLASIVVF